MIKINQNSTLDTFYLFKPYVNMIKAVSSSVFKYVLNICLPLPKGVFIKEVGEYDNASDVLPILISCDWEKVSLPITKEDISISFVQVLLPNIDAKGIRVEIISDNTFSLDDIETDFGDFKLNPLKNPLHRSILIPKINGATRSVMEEDADPKISKTTTPVDGVDLDDGLDIV